MCGYVAVAAVEVIWGKRKSQNFENMKQRVHKGIQTRIVGFFSNARTSQRRISALTVFA